MWGKPPKAEAAGPWADFVTMMVSQLVKTQAENISCEAGLKIQEDGCVESKGKGIRRVGSDQLPQSKMAGKQDALLWSCFYQIFLRCD